MSTDANPVDVHLIKAMVREIITTRPDEMDCPECYEHLGQYADVILSGQDGAAAMPRLQDHLEHCSFCREEFEALLIALRNLG
jgi:hypothetical protein